MINDEDKMMGSKVSADQSLQPETGFFNKFHAALSIKETKLDVAGLED